MIEVVINIMLEFNYMRTIRKIKYNLSWLLFIRSCHSNL